VSEEASREICHCGTGGIGPHYHDPKKYRCPMQAVPVRPGSTLIGETLRAAGEAIREIAAKAETEPEQLTLDPDDPFEAVLIDMVRLNRRKRRDYALDTSPFSNFDTSAAGMGMKGFGAVEAAIFNVNQKLARLRSLRANGRMDDPANETVEDTYLDLAIYAAIALAIYRYPEGKVA